MITMTEIAKLTHVSQPTVSRVLNGSMTVAPEIRERVLACAREHDYQLNALAKGLQGSKTKLLGVLVTDISNGFLPILRNGSKPRPGKTGTAPSCSTAITTPGTNRSIWMWSGVTG